MQVTAAAPGNRARGRSSVNGFTLWREIRRSACACPLSSLPDVLLAEIDHEHPVDPFAPRGALPNGATQKRQAGKVRGAKPREVVKTALTVQVRNGHLYAFMPPLKRIEDFAALLAAIEDTAQAVGAPIAIEGYTPPRDPRIRVLNVTPDPGVIEVNIHPAASWRELLADDLGVVRGSAADASRHRKIHARWPPYRHRRRQPRHARRSDACRQPVAAAPRSVAQPGDVLAESPRAVVPVFPGPSSVRRARRRAWTRRATIGCTNWRSRSSNCRACTARAREKHHLG